MSNKCDEDGCNEPAIWRDAENQEWCDRHRHSLTARMPRDDDMIVVEMVTPEGATDDDILTAVKELASGMDDLHRALGGSGLKVESVSVREVGMSEEQFFREFFRAMLLGGLGTPAQYIQNEEFMDMVYREIKRHQAEKTWERTRPSDFRKVEQ